MNNFITLKDPKYPPILKQIYKAPEKLYYKGNVDVLGGNLIAFVGTRSFTPYGKYCVEKLISELSLCDFVIVSGLARGIDTLAHENALRCGLKTVAILGTGIENIYPFENEELARRIIADGGCILSEYEDKIPGKKFTFPMRNRIIAGLCVATVIVEAPSSSGALITAKRANEEDRDVFAVPGDIDRVESVGCNKLVQGLVAKPVMCGMDIIRELKMQPKLVNDVAGSDDKDFLKTLRLDETTVCVLDSISQTRPVCVEDIVAASRCPLIEVNKSLSLLEIHGLVQGTDSGFYLRSC